MKREQDSQEKDTNALRRRAEARLSEARKDRKAVAEDRMTAAEMRRFLQELQIHQIELEMQNEELKQAQDEVRKFQEELEQRVEERTAQLAASNKELEAFCYSVSHDLQSPLRAIDGYSRMILKIEGDRFDKETLSKFEVIRGNVHKMGQLIEDLLAFSRLGRRSLSIAEVDMDAVVKMAWENLRALHPDRAMTLKSKGLTPAVGDRELIRQVVTNLLSNAVKFAKPGKEVVVEAGAYREGNDTVYTIKDNGVGFDMAYYGKLFGMFQRLHNPDEYEGTGVGLAIAQRIILRHGGRIWAKAKENEGATFYFLLPSTHGTMLPARRTG